jgi:glycosyltransferase involved in cell wall biosynthesis
MTDPPAGRVLVLSDRLGRGGMSRYLVEVTRALTDLGHACTVLTPRTGATDAELAPLRARGVDTRTPDRLSPFLLRRTVRQTRPACVKLCTGAFPPDTTYPLWLAGTGVPIVETLHVLPRRRRVRPLQALFYRLRPKRRYAVVAFTAEVEDHVRRLAPALSCRLRRLTYGMALPDAGLEPGVPSWPLRLITICRLDEAQKDVETLLRAVAQLRLSWRGHGTAPTLTIAGDGPDAAALKSLAAELGLGDAARFIGWAEDPVAELRRHHLFVLSTRRESPGRVNIEAAAVGLPVIASDVEGCRESVHDGVNGRLVAPGNAPALAAAIEALAFDTEARRAFGAAGPAFASRFAMGDHARALAAIARDIAR